MKHLLQVFPHSKRYLFSFSELSFIPFLKASNPQNSHNFFLQVQFHQFENWCNNSFFVYLLPEIERKSIL